MGTFYPEQNSIHLSLFTKTQKIGASFTADPYTNIKIKSIMTFRKIPYGKAERVAPEGKRRWPITGKIGLTFSAKKIFFWQYYVNTSKEGRSMLCKSLLTNNLQHCWFYIKKSKSCCHRSHILPWSSSRKKGKTSQPPLSE